MVEAGYAVNHTDARDEAARGCGIRRDAAIDQRCLSSAAPMIAPGAASSALLASRGKPTAKVPASRCPRQQVRTSRCRSPQQLQTAVRCSPSKIFSCASPQEGRVAAGRRRLSCSPGWVTGKSYTGTGGIHGPSRFPSSGQRWLWPPRQARNPQTRRRDHPVATCCSSLRMIRAWTPGAMAARSKRRAWTGSPHKARCLRRATQRFHPAARAVRCCTAAFIHMSTACTAWHNDVHNQSLLDWVVTLPKLMSAAGYATALVGQKTHTT